MGLLSPYSSGSSMGPVSSRGVKFPSVGVGGGAWTRGGLSPPRDARLEVSPVLRVPKSRSGGVVRGRGA